MHMAKMFIPIRVTVKDKPANVTWSLFPLVTLLYVIIMLFLCFKCFTACGKFADKITLFWIMGSLSML